MYAIVVVFGDFFLKNRFGFLTIFFSKKQQISDRILFFNKLFSPKRKSLMGDVVIISCHTRVPEVSASAKHLTYSNSN